MYKDSAGFVVLPGGLGTLDEMMEVMTWKQLGLLQAPVFALDIAGYWQPLLGMMDHAEKQDLFIIAALSIFMLAATRIILLTLLISIWGKTRAKTCSWPCTDITKPVQSRVW